MQPNETALRFLGNTVTWAQLHNRVAALAGALSRRGVGFGDRVMILMLTAPSSSNRCWPQIHLGPSRCR